MTNLPAIKPQALDKDFVCRQLLEIVDIARTQGNVTIALEGMSMIAAIHGMFDDSLGE